MSDNAEAWHLPKFMRDFHDQKDLFRAIAYYDAEYLRSDEEICRHPSPNWMEAHVYTVDVFLRFMAEHGYTLQRCRRDVNFKDIDETVGWHAGQRRQASAEALKSIMK